MGCGGAEVATDYRFEVVCAEPQEAHIRVLAVHSVNRPGFQLRSVHSQDAVDHKVTVSALLTADRRDDTLLEQAVSRLSLGPAVSAVDWAVLPASEEREDSAPSPPFRRSG